MSASYLAAVNARSADKVGASTSGGDIVYAVALQQHLTAAISPLNADPAMLAQPVHVQQNGMNGEAIVQVERISAQQ